MPASSRTSFESARKPIVLMHGFSTQVDFTAFKFRKNLCPDFAEHGWCGDVKFSVRIILRCRDDRLVTTGLRFANSTDGYTSLDRAGR